MAISKLRDAKLEGFARETAADIGEPLEAAIRAMRDEPGEVARATDIPRAYVVNWTKRRLTR